MHNHALNLDSFITIKLSRPLFLSQHQNEPFCYNCFYITVALSTLREHTSIVDKVVQLLNVDKNWDKANGGKGQAARGGKWSQV